MDKPAKKRAGAPFKPGFDPRRNLTTPGPGRPPDKYMEQLRDILHDPKVLERIRENLISNPDNHLFAKLWDKVHDKLHPKQLELSQDPEKPLFTESPLDLLARRLDRIAGRLESPEGSSGA